MEIEYGFLRLKKIRNLENKLNKLAHRGWRVVCSTRKGLVLKRKIRVER